VGIAIVDTGIDLANTDLNLGTSSYSSVSASAQDDHGHGTHVAGIAAAENNSEGVVGVAPSATLYAVKVLDASGSGTDGEIIAGLNWVAANAALVNPPIRVVNMSLGRLGSVDDNPLLHEAIQTLTQTKNVTVVVAAGNDPTVEVKNNVPATYSEIIAVASTTAANGTSGSSRFSVIKQDTASYFTTDGAYDTAGIGVTISAPGEDQENISKAGMIASVGILSTKVGGGTLRMSGTSMAAPHVTGVVALLCQKHGLGYTPEQARSAIIGGAVNVDTAPLNSPTRTYSFDDEREGVLSAPGALSQP
jgi:subtilisin